MSCAGSLAAAGAKQIAMTSEDRKTILLDRLADHVLANGLMSASLRPLAKAAGTSDRMLLYYFKDKADLIGAILDRLAEQMIALLNQSKSPQRLPIEMLTPQLLQMLQVEQAQPYLNLWLETAALAARGDQVSAACGKRIGHAFLDWIAEQIEAPNEQARRQDAARLLVMIEGSVLLKSLDLEEIVETAFTDVG